MAIVGHHPETGMRVVVERERSERPPWRYEGEAVTQTARFVIIATVEADGTVNVELPPEAPAGLGTKARLMLRAVCKHAAGDGSDPPQRIARWRADR